VEDKPVVFRLNQQYYSFGLEWGLKNEKCLVYTAACAETKGTGWIQMKLTQNIQNQLLKCCGFFINK
jgi:hypothetical protein